MEDQIFKVLNKGATIYLPSRLDSLDEGKESEHPAEKQAQGQMPANLSYFMDSIRNG